MNISGVMNSYFNNSVAQRSSVNYTKLAPLACDTVSFSGKNQGQPVVTGTDYSELKGMKLSRSKTIPELAEAGKKGEDISSERDKLILSRIDNIIAIVDKFIAEHPEAEQQRDDLTQDLILKSIEHTDKQLDGSKDAYIRFYQDKDDMFKAILETPETTPIQQVTNISDGIDFTYDTVEQIALQDAVASTLETLTPRQEYILKKRMGIMDGRTYTLEEVGNEFNVPRERIRQIEAKAIRDMRHPKRSRMLKDFY